VNRRITSPGTDQPRSDEPTNSRTYNCFVPLRSEIGQLVIGSLPSYTITPEIRALAREFQLCGLILFARNVEAPEQVAELAHDAQTLVREVPLWVSVDQEGGRVARLKAPFTEWPPMAVLGRSGDPALAARFAKALAAELRAVGVTLDYAPVLDILTNPKNPAIGDRALADDAGLVARLGAAIIRTLQEHDVAACGKHFPGHGDTAVDSHFDLPLVEHSPDRLRRVEFVPFRAAIDANVAFMMTGHVLVPSLDEENPGTLSRAVVSGLLRDELGFGGVILTDDIDMKAIAARYTGGEAAVKAIAAGCDGVLVCGGAPEAHATVLEALVHAVEDGRIPRTRVEDALARHRRAKERFLAAPASIGRTPLRAVLGADEHRRVAEEMSRYL
jgi:beta-N-acetylhexosaminidase